MLAFFAVITIRLIRPWILVRFEALRSTRIGHFAGDVEMYLCERDAKINIPVQNYIDIFYITEPISNQQLATMWKRVLYIWPEWLVAPIMLVNRLLPSGGCHEVGQNTQGARDVHNLLDQLPPHLIFTKDEEAWGKAGLLEMGLPIGAQFVCLNVRDSAYLGEHMPNNDWSYHNYRDCDIQNYVMTADALAECGYFVIRMGAKVNASINSANPKVIDYAANGMRSDFMDIYLGAKCAFCITTGSGWDCIPEMFRRPLVYTNMLPLGCLNTFSSKSLSITKRHVWESSGKALTLSEIFSNGVGFCMNAQDFHLHGVSLIENTPEEIRDIAVEMATRIDGSWHPHEDDASLQQRFWELFPTNALDSYSGNRLHGEIHAHFGAVFLRNNLEWLQ